MSAFDNTEIIWSHVELTAGTVKATGELKFFIDAVDVEGGRATFHICDDYEDAIRMGEETRNAFEIDMPVFDKVVGAN